VGGCRELDNLQPIQRRKSAGWDAVAQQANGQSVVTVIFKSTSGVVVTIRFGPGVSHDDGLKYAAEVFRAVMPECRECGVTIAMWLGTMSRSCPMPRARRAAARRVNPASPPSSALTFPWSTTS
jgi:hypothetical protein